MSRDADLPRAATRGRLLYCIAAGHGRRPVKGAARQGRPGSKAARRGACLPRFSMRSWKAAIMSMGAARSTPFSSGSSAGTQAGGLEGNIRTRMLAVLLTQPSSATQPAAGRQTEGAEWPAAGAGAGAPTQPTPPTHLTRSAPAPAPRAPRQTRCCPRRRTAPPACTAGQLRYRWCAAVQRGGYRGRAGEKSEGASRGGGWVSQPEG